MLRVGEKLKGSDFGRWVLVRVLPARGGGVGGVGGVGGGEEEKESVFEVT